MHTCISAAIWDKLKGDLFGIHVLTTQLVLILTSYFAIKRILENYENKQKKCCVCVCLLVVLTQTLHSLYTFEQISPSFHIQIN